MSPADNAVTMTRSSIACSRMSASLVKRSSKLWPTANTFLTRGDSGSGGRSDGSWSAISSGSTCSTLVNVLLTIFSRGAGSSCLSTIFACTTSGFCRPGDHVTSEDGASTGIRTPTEGGPGRSVKGTAAGPGAGGQPSGGGKNGITVRLNVVAPIVPPAPSLTVNVKLSPVLGGTMGTYHNRPALISA